MFTTRAICDVAAYIRAVGDNIGVSSRSHRRRRLHRDPQDKAVGLNEVNSLRGGHHVGNTSRGLIESLRAAFSAGCVTYRYPTKTKRGAYLWNVQSHVARDVLRAVYPYLIVKREQATVLMEFVDDFDSFKGARPGKKGGQVVSPGELARRERLYQQMRSLNRVGPRASDLPANNGRLSVGVTAEFASKR